MKQNVIEMHHIIKRFFEGQENELQILNGIDLSVADGEFLSIVGESGSGKSTLMNLIGLLDRPTEGTYFLDGIDVSQATDANLSALRNKKIGFVFQTYNLIPRMNALKNVEVPLMYGGVSRKDRQEKAMELMEMVGMSDRMEHKPEELSGGPTQRGASAQAMANDPSIILADEPTGALDSKTGHMIMDIFHDLHENHGKTIVLITHSNVLAEETERIVTLMDGRVIDERITGGEPHVS